MFKLVLEKAEEPEIKLPTSIGSLKKEESSRKTSISALLTMPKPLTVWITITCGKFWKRWEYHTTWPASWEICMQVRKQQFELDMEQPTRYNPYHNPSWVLCRKWQTDLKIHVEIQGIPKNQMVLKKNKAGGHTFLDLKTDYKAIKSKQCYWHNDT